MVILMNCSLVRLRNVSVYVGVTPGTLYPKFRLTFIDSYALLSKTPTAWTSTKILHKLFIACTIIAAPMHSNTAITATVIAASIFIPRFSSS